MLRVMGEDGARGKDWLRARGHHLFFFRFGLLVKKKQGQGHCGYMYF